MRIGRKSWHNRWKRSGAKIQMLEANFTLWNISHVSSDSSQMETQQLVYTSYAQLFNDCEFIMTSMMIRRMKLFKYKRLNTNIKG